MADEENNPENPEEDPKKRFKRRPDESSPRDPVDDPSVSDEVKKAYAGMEVKYGLIDVENTRKVVEEEMELNELDTQFEVERRLKKQQDEENQKRDEERRKEERKKIAQLVEREMKDGKEPNFNDKIE